MSTNAQILTTNLITWLISKTTHHVFFQYHTNRFTVQSQFYHFKEVDGNLQVYQSIDFGSMEEPGGIIHTRTSFEDTH